MSARVLLCCAALSGFVAVAMGAFGAHALKTVLSAELAAVYRTAVDYQFYHTLALLAVALLRREQPATAFTLAGGCFMLGTLLFSGSLYILALSGIHWLGAVTPIGGGLLLVGWLALAWGGYRWLTTAPTI
ncbi:DUF423 domain-containing protein [Marinobacterium arenosum]|uniref:DUF423 domain-containing protein n=1 Tax=Marinobacterium arenosum TaxID=2862496 RepID=UPI001C968C8C|nr:DUF423 domain-containing protein [Marinobacterium arenosum]MBY4678628.1 DUF423 domain-containing protein [Marinobacterium arenosum]